MILYNGAAWNHNELDNGSYSQVEFNSTRLLLWYRLLHDKWTFSCASMKLSPLGVRYVPPRRSHSVKYWP